MTMDELRRQLKTTRWLRNPRMLTTLIVLLALATWICYFIYTKWAHLDQNHSINQMADDWINSPDRETSWKSWSPITQDRVYEVPANFIEEAVRLLSDTSVIQLTEEQYVKYAGPNCKALEEYKAYLIRGVMARGTRMTGNFEVREQGTTLWVSYGYLSTKHHPIVKQPLIVVLSKNPTTNFVTVAGAI